MGALTSSPPPPAAGGSGNTPPAPVRRVGEAAEQPGALQRRGAGKSARMGARPPPPRSPVRQQAPSPPASDSHGRARISTGRRPRVAQKRADSRLQSPHLHYPPPTATNPLQASDSALT